MAEYHDDDEGGLEVGPPGTLGRIRHVSEDGHQLTVELRGGQIATVTSNDATELAVGDVVTVRDNALDRVPDELWVEQTWVGVVKIKRPDRTVIDSGGRWQLLRTNAAVEYAVGNTVEVSDSVGVVEILHPDGLHNIAAGLNWDVEVDIRHRIHSIGTCTWIGVTLL